jgi:murein DD-endopeptidase MepM/ murein hydrolase activator NlpD
MLRALPRRRGRRAAVVCLLVALPVLALGTTRSHADRITDQIAGRQHQRDRVGGVIGQLRSTLAALHTREGLLRALVAQLDGRITLQVQAVSSAQSSLDRLAADLAQAEARLAQTRTRLAGDREVLARQVVAIYKLGTTSAVNVLLGSESFGQLWQRSINLRRIAGGEHDVVTAVRDEEASVAATVARIDQDREAQARLTAQLGVEARRLEAARDQRQRDAEELAAVEASDRQQLALAEQSARELEAQIQALRRAEEEARRRAAGTGRFLWPLQGVITQGFGCTPYPFEPYAPGCPSRHFHSGIDIATGYGTPVIAADNGVAYDYPSSYGYGNHVIVIHGNGWVSVYGHLSRFAVEGGQVVRAGRVIGYEGSTGNSTGPHLHFEIRFDDAPRNPLQYLP